jgi:hypothetical protein
MDFFRSFGYEPNAMTPDKWHVFSYICLIKSFRDVGSWILSAYSEADHISRDKYDPILELTSGSNSALLPLSWTNHSSNSFSSGLLAGAFLCPKGRTNLEG